MMLNDFEGFTIWSEDYKELAKWYQEKFDLKKVDEINLPNDQAIAFEINPESKMYLWIGYHSKVHGGNKDKYRLMISYWVDDVHKAYEKLRKRGVKFIANPHAAPTGDLNVATAIDPEDNMIQLYSLQYRY